MKLHRQKVRERAHLERFRNACPVFPPGDIRETEKPDFVVVDSGENVGIEHTEFHLDDAPARGTPLRAQEALRQQVVSNALRLHESRSLPIVDVLLRWSIHHNLTSRSVRQVAAALADFVRAHMPDSNQDASIECTADGWELLRPFPPRFHRQKTVFSPFGGLGFEGGALGNTGEGNELRCDRR